MRRCRTWLQRVYGGVIVRRTGRQGDTADVVCRMFTRLFDSPRHAATAPGGRSWLLCMVASIAGLVPWCLFSSAHRQTLPRLQAGGTPPANRGSGVRPAPVCSFGYSNVFARRLIVALAIRTSREWVSRTGLAVLEG